MKVALFGANGFLGGAVTHELVAAGHTVTSVGRQQVALERDDAAEALSRLDIEADVVINCIARVPAARDTLDDAPSMFAVNAVGASHVAQWAASRGARRLVHVSTLVVVQRPWPTPLTEDSPTYPLGPVAGYAASKLAGELMCQSVASRAGMTCTVLRLAALYGPRMPWTGVLPTFVDQALADRRLTVTSGGHADFLHISDAAGALARAAEGEFTGVVNVASGVETSLVHLAEAVLKACGRPSTALDVVDSDVARAVVDTRRMRDLGMTAEVSLDDGLVGVVAERRLA
jgi:nucleoside-diphosphate-sugar epimerase